MGMTSCYEAVAAAASPKLLDRVAALAATTGRVAASWMQWGATIGPCPTR